MRAGDEIVAELGPELPQADPNVRSWPLYPTSAFERIRPVIAASEAMRHEPFEPFPPSITSLAEGDERARAMQTWARTNPQSQRRVAMVDQVRALKLSVADASGAALETWNVGVNEFPGVPSIPFQEWMRPDFERAGFRGDPPFHIAVATINPPAWLGPDALREHKLRFDPG